MRKHLLSASIIGVVAFVLAVPLPVFAQGLEEVEVPVVGELFVE